MTKANAQPQCWRKEPTVTPEERALKILPPHTQRELPYTEGIRMSEISISASWAAFTNYHLPHPPSLLKHRERRWYEIILGWFISSHICQICHRKEPFIAWLNGGWNQIDDPYHHDSAGCSVVCQECWDLNLDFFNKNVRFDNKIHFGPFNDFGLNI